MVQPETVYNIAPATPADVMAAQVAIIAEIPDAADVIDTLKTATGFTQGGTWPLAKLMKVLAAWTSGKWQDKTGVAGTYEVLDPDDGATVILEITPSAVSPQRIMVVKI